ncbi:MAG: class II fumarate hydratase [Parachlamydiales bacterium]|jgi:fumarate hydratase class II
MRRERDSLGEVLVEEEKFWGASTQRALNNFYIGNEKIPLEIIYALAIIKKASAIANYKLNQLAKEKKDLIVFAADEILAKKYDEHFPLHIWQTGSGTSTNMNVNEVICNIASFKLNKILGSKDPIHPNDDVNMSQSTNDTFPSALNISAYLLIKNRLLDSLEQLKTGFDEKVIEFNEIIKVGRTHLMDAIPMTLGQEFSAFSSTVSEGIENIKSSLEKLAFLPLGATAVGTGLNTHKKFSKVVIEEISSLTKEKFHKADNFFHSLSFADPVCSMSSALKNLASSLFKIANDLSLLSSGPRCGIGEIILPPIEPGSSIMPGKINPSMCEAMKMVSMQVVSNDSMISSSNSLGNFQLNVFRPLQGYALIQSVNLLADMSDMFLKHCLKGLKANLIKIKEHLDKNLMVATVLNKSIGYENASKIVLKAYQEDITLKQAAKELNLVDEKKFDEIVNLKNLLSPHD